jgi:hypothetical protein
MKVLPTELRICTIASLYESFQRGDLVIQLGFQRPSVWSEKAKSLLIDTILKNLPVPLLVMRQRMDLGKGQILTEIVDGQQRLGAIFDFLEGKFKISKGQDSEYGNLRFQELPEDIKKSFLMYQLPASILVGVSDSEVLDIFSRMNQYSPILSSQEFLEARFPGAFEQVVSKLSLDHLEFWKRNRILTENRIARKGDSELTALLVVAMLDGLQEGKKSLAVFYEKYSDSFPFAAEIIAKFRSTIDLIAFVFEDQLSKSYFKRPALFYSLFCVFYDCKYGLPKMNMGRVPINEKTKKPILRALIGRGDVADKWHEKEYDELEQASFVSSDRLRTREIRHRLIWDIINSAVNKTSQG